MIEFDRLYSYITFLTERWAVPRHEIQLEFEISLATFKLDLAKHCKKVSKDLTQALKMIRDINSARNYNDLDNIRVNTKVSTKLKVGSNYKNDT